VGGPRSPRTNPRMQTLSTVRCMNILMLETNEASSSHKSSTAARPCTSNQAHRFRSNPRKDFSRGSAGVSGEFLHESPFSHQSRLVVKGPRTFWREVRPFGRLVVLVVALVALSVERSKFWPSRQSQPIIGFYHGQHGNLNSCFDHQPSEIFTRDPMSVLRLPMSITIGRQLKLRGTAGLEVG
jgi:hypothetical protein